MAKEGDPEHERNIRRRSPLLYIRVLVVSKLLLSRHSPLALHTYSGNDKKASLLLMQRVVLLYVIFTCSSALLHCNPIWASYHATCDSNILIGTRDYKSIVKCRCFNPIPTLLRILSPILCKAYHHQIYLESSEWTCCPCSSPLPHHQVLEFSSHYIPTLARSTTRHLHPNIQSIQLYQPLHAAITRRTDICV